MDDMKEKVRLIFILVLFLVYLLPLAASVVNQTAIDNGYQCLEDRIEEVTCAALSTAEKIFSVLAVNECKTELEDEVSSEGCWPFGACDVKTTSQAILALGSSGTTDAQDWLISQNKTPEEITWYLQIDTVDTSTCSISYDSNSYSIDIDEDKKLNASAGNCLILTPSGYWLEISGSCYEQEFEISCDQGFLTNLLFKKQDSPTIHVLEDTTSASSDGTTKEQVNSFCFSGADGTCDYEGSLWTVLVLDSLGKDVTPYLPYLITMAEENENFLPEAFLYSLTGSLDAYTELTSRQFSSGYWQVSGDKYYDTALVTYFIQESSNEWQEAETALLNDQQASGCWDSDDILNTAFILYSLWPMTS